MQLFFRLITVPLLLLFLFAGCADINWDPPATPPQNNWTPPPMTRGLKWVRNNPMFISALTVSMGNPPSDFVNEYFNRFNANAVHYGKTGCLRRWMLGKKPETDASVLSPGCCRTAPVSTTESWSGGIRPIKKVESVTRSVTNPGR